MAKRADAEAHMDRFTELFGRFCDAKSVQPLEQMNQVTLFTCWMEAFQFRNEASQPGQPQQSTQPATPKIKIDPKASDKQKKFIKSLAGQGYVDTQVLGRLNSMTKIEASAIIELGKSKKDEAEGNTE